MDFDETLAFIQGAHAGQTDKIGAPYWRHPYSVSQRIPDATEHEKIVALLHDVLEDTRYTAGDLAGLGYLPSIVRDVQTLTRSPDKRYPAFIKDIANFGSRAAIRVKIADCEDNLDPCRLALLDEKERERLTLKYEAALFVLRRALAP